MKIAIYPGSFDPVTNGHLDIIRRASGIFDKVIVAVSINHQKKPLFSVEERVEITKRVIAENTDIKNVEVDTFIGLLADYADRKGAGVIIKGLRAVSDFEYEFQMALMNKKLSNHIETLFMMTSQEYSYLSSSIVKEVGKLGGDLNGLVPESVIKELKLKLK